MKTTTSNATNAANILGDLANTVTPATAKPSLNPSRPSAEWTLAELGKFARRTVKKSAESSWELGRVLVLAKQKASRKFGAWCSEYVPELSVRTIQRYMAVGRLDWDDVRGKSVSDIYALLWGKQEGKQEGEEAKPANSTKQVSNNIAKLTKLLSSPDVVLANREALVALRDKLAELLG